jgi:putative FmdB family regulatory protein
MPTYEYKCRKCGHQFEKFQSITAAPAKTCPKCKGKVVRMLTFGAGIIFKGSGFYQTDYKKTANASHATKKTDEKKAESPKADSKPDKSAK